MKLTDFYENEKKKIINDCILCGNCVRYCRVMEYTGNTETPADIQKSIVDHLKNGTELSSGAKLKTDACMRCFGCLDVKCPIETTSTTINEIVDRERHLKDADPFGEIDNYPVHEELARKGCSDEEYARITTEKIDEDAEIVFFPGCNVYKQPDKLLNALTILDEIGTKYSFLPGMKNCCGWTERARYGDADSLQTDATKLMNKIEDLKAKKVVFWCPTCLCVLESRIDKFYKPEFEYETFGQYIFKNIDKLSFPEAKPATVTVHEPCKTAYMGIDLEDNSVRKLLESIPGTKLVEMEHHGSDTMCCGCDAVYNMFEVGDKVSVERLKEADATGADFMIDVCHNCHWLLKPCQKNHDELSNVFEIVNYSTYITDAMGKGRKDSLE